MAICNDQRGLQATEVVLARIEPSPRLQQLVAVRPVFSIIDNDIVPLHELQPIIQGFGFRTGA